MLKGAEVTDLVTYCTTRASNGSWHAKGEGVIMTKDGSETITYTGGGMVTLQGLQKLDMLVLYSLEQQKGSLNFSIIR